MAPAALAKIRELDPSARVLWSVYTRGHYVSARIEDGSEPGILSGFCEHRSTPGEAVLAYWGRVIKSPRLVVGAYTESRREVFWDAAHGRWENYGTEVDTTDMLEVSPSARAMGRELNVADMMNTYAAAYSDADNDRHRHGLRAVERWVKAELMGEEKP